MQGTCAEIAGLPQPKLDSGLRSTTVPSLLTRSFHTLLVWYLKALILFLKSRISEDSFCISAEMNRSGYLTSDPREGS